MNEMICRACQAGNHWECYLPECECGCDPDLFEDGVQDFPTDDFELEDFELELDELYPLDLEPMDLPELEDDDGV